ncbi:thiol reductant ABC exporter subunit CydC [Jonesia denitrificans]|uniref:ABC transporter, CydDC cysteine exporter (CydDC-E) family, permease/ATP-binding protein CydC n=1 Tax=Jonesia denitrificans (strain ATCC 14870 / DSM 20603 / BCRC 15368 / CIP 55.134 / JCM 11481 / NBRC 15587 / NCTC 10816 / Prevot 55134) TaxID=471856 RepID=C7QYM1_JONDD|nr:thiol reductant ABC exporter subunit CydC [Jonesia denitrificans]ACV07868.1 ABC transporter, CydDC cysteine exporter (CydDC- E) family, permease/ATP-binding protein CydC [Jonesia denitrificans DSM 20603]ASE08424.1 thiol reductant ABC exporter subunit CydC [Jonesia denitrificans]QXB43027.1 thiol reductant ABC exporter subunit CydC [Jonesia denitrificans]SQH19841.1 Probable ABC transporter ATP-binding protein HI_0664 [Jonesia denitrificans]
MNQSLSALWWSATHVRSVLWPLIISTVCRIIDQVLAVALLAVAATGVARAVTSTVHVGHLVLVLAGLTLMKAIVRYVEQYSGHYVAFKALEELRVFAFSRLWPGAPANTVTAHTGDLLTRVTKDIDRVEVFFAHTIAPVISAVVVPVGVLVWLGAATSPVVAWIAAVGVFLVGVVTPTVGWWFTQRVSAGHASDRTGFSQTVTETVQGVADIVGYGYEHPWLERSTSLIDTIAQDNTHRGTITAIRRSLTVAFTLITVLLVLGDAGARFVQGTFTVEQLALAVAVTLSSFSASKAIDTLLADLDVAGSAAARLRAAVSTQPAVVDPAHPVSLPAGGLSVQWDAVTFAYPGAPVPVLTDVSLSIPAGSRAVIVGRSGSGKSTLAHLLLRFWDCDQGRILVGGVPITDVVQDELRGRVALVSQRTHLFAMSIADNLRLADPSASDERLRQVCEVAQLMEDIDRFPDGWDTLVGEFGESLSGGQRQRVALARALLTPADVFVLDEYTSSLDEVTAQRLRVALRGARPGATLIEITHRPSDAADADLVFQVDHGIVTQVTAEEVLAAVPER